MALLDDSLRGAHGMGVDRVGAPAMGEGAGMNRIMAKRILDNYMSHILRISMLGTLTGLGEKVITNFCNSKDNEQEVSAEWMAHFAVFGRGLDFRRSFTPNGNYVTVDALKKIVDKTKLPADDYMVQL